MKYVKRPCDACPWRVDAESGRFEEERWECLVKSGPDERGMGPEFGAPLFACHKTPMGEERACAGWLAQVGAAHPSVRLAVLTGSVPPEALEPKEDWPDLFDTVQEAAEHDLTAL